MHSETQDGVGDTREKRNCEMCMVETLGFHMSNQNLYMKVLILNASTEGMPVKISRKVKIVLTEDLKQPVS